MFRVIDPSNGSMHPYTFDNTSSLEIMWFVPLRYAFPRRVNEDILMVNIIDKVLNSKYTDNDPQLKKDVRKALKQAEDKDD